MPENFGVALPNAIIAAPNEFAEVTVSPSESAQPKNTSPAPSKVSHAELAIKTIDSETIWMKLCVDHN